ncbi:hypothetical protein COB21_06195 [Candidatus Aerophobetes bacterium]|uniref:DNA polymerase III subunit delta n=1 Tax=Aerophobetes bacterium TaxID=2030807 RepID=A0A2A4WYP6_UNCAE|nr:MAG: hypothetical protein COB21_06195 [Candidatus Aerophobetes bacterium]
MPFSSIQGHSYPKKVLMQLLKAERLPRSLIFCGPDGVGKKSVARAFVQEIFGSETKLENCVDFFKIFPESKAGEYQKDQIDQIRKFVQTEAYSAKIKVCLIQRAEGLSQVHANALLKTVEEPAANVVFIFITQFQKALIPTLISRSMVLLFSPLSWQDVQAYLLEKESISSKEEAQTIAKRSMGCIGRAKAYLLNADLHVDMYSFELGKALYLGHILLAVDLCKKIEKEVADNKVSYEAYLQGVYAFFKDLYLLEVQSGALLFFQSHREELEQLQRQGLVIDLSKALKAYHGVKEELKLHLPLKTLVPYRQWV